MTTFARGLRVGASVIGLAALLAACQSGLNDEDRALLQQSQADSRAAQAAADRAAEAADRAAAAAAEAADAAATASMSAERESRMTSESMRK
jgi:hypothetical protein